MSRMERNKGAAGEREVAAILTAAGFPASRNARNGISSEDVAHAIPGVYLEVKRRETAEIWKWVAQAATATGAMSDTLLPEIVPVVVFRRNRSEWLACLPFADLIELLPKGER